MKSLTKDRWLQWMTLVTFILMVTVNALANILPINGISSGAVSDAYFNLFAPIGFTFSIWGLIYSLLLVFTLYQGIGYFKKGFEAKAYLRPVAIIFSLTSVINSTWIFAWHYRRIGISLILMALLLVGLIRINLILRKIELSSLEKWTVGLPFSIYFGWITVASIANVTTYLVSINWNGFGIDPSLITMVVLTVGAIIGVLAIYAYRDIPFGLVILWAYYGILAKHRSPEYFNSQYGNVMTTLVVLIALVALFELFMVYRIKTEKETIVGQ